MRELLRDAYTYGSVFSQDPITHLGALLVLSDGYKLSGVNMLPLGVQQSPGRLERPVKYLYMEHAERNVILKAARNGLSTDGATLYCPWITCADCARAIIGAGITKVVGHKQLCDLSPARWSASIEAGLTMLREAGVDIEFYDGSIGGVRTLFDGKVWEP